MKHTEIALALSRDIPKVYRLALETLAKVTLRQGDYTQTLQIYKELLAFDKANGFYLVHRGETLLQIGECQLALGETQRALDSLQQALEHGERSGNKLYIVNCHRLLSEAYKRSGEFEKALGHYELFHTHHEAMFSESSETRVRALEVRHRMDTLKQESELLKQKNTELARHNEALQELHKRVHELSIRDPLTGLYNRRHLFEQTGELLKLTRRYSHPLSVAMLDIDHFKEINDTFGHKIGDAVLECIGELLRSTLRETDLTARYGGEEFALVMPNTALEDAVGVCERLRQHISDYPWSTLRTALKVNVSLGLAASSPLEDPLESSEAGDLFARADEQLYLAKRSGRNRIRF